MTSYSSTLDSHWEGLYKTSSPEHVIKVLLISLSIKKKLFKPEIDTIAYHDLRDKTIKN